MVSSDGVVRPAIPAPNFHPPFDITRASHVVLRVRDLMKSRAFYVDALGFVVSDATADRLYLRGLEEGLHLGLFYLQNAA